MKPIAIVQHEAMVPPGLIGEVLDELRIPTLLVEAWSDPRWPAPDEISGLVTMGGTMNVDQESIHPFLASSKRLMAGALDDGLPVLGVCLGSQMLARVCGAPVRRSPRRSAGFSKPIVHGAAAADPVAGPFAHGTEVLQFHEDTFDVPARATLLLTAPDGTNQAFRAGHNAYGIQFHFEVSEPIVRAWCTEIGPAGMLERWGTSVEALLDNSSERFAAQRECGRRSVEAFVSLCRSNKEVA
jgi:GMP synthase (glutamine-hydrolysing)